MTSPTTQTANAIAAIRNKGSMPVPEIDFTVHTLENGDTVSTTERVVKDVSGAAYSCCQCSLSNTTGPSSRHVHPDGRAVLVQDGPDKA